MLQPKPIGSFLYKGSKTKEISFPLGGIGTGCIGLGGDGRLVDWEIFNRPNKRSLNGFSHFAIKAESQGKVVDARVLNGDLHPPFTGDGFGPKRNTMAGVPHFAETEFEGKYPFAKVRFIDNKFPGEIELMAFNPFIPLNDKNSSIPGAFFEIRVKNNTHMKLTYTINASLSNPFPPGSGFDEFKEKNDVKMIKLGSLALKENDLDFGSLILSTDADDVSYQEYWYREKRFGGLSIYWKDFTSFGKFKNREYPRPGSAPQKNTDVSETSTEFPNDTCSLASHFSLGPGEEKCTRFIITWNFPNSGNYWNPDNPGTWKNYYSVLFKDSEETAVYSFENWNRLYEETRKFNESLFSSTLPPAVLDAVSANISILKSPTCLRYEDGSFWGFEGCRDNEGCCPGSCTHVWNYAYALPFLFPKLERSMRDLNYRFNMLEHGSLAFRVESARPPRKCADRESLPPGKFRLFLCL